MMTETHATMTTAELDAYVSECERMARREGWTGEWALQPADLNSLMQDLGRKLTATEALYLRVPKWASMHVDWQSDVLASVLRHEEVRR